MAEKGDLFAQQSASFVDWFRSADGTRLSSKIELADLRTQQAGRGVVATQDLEEDEELFAIPRPLVLAASTSSIPQDILAGLEEHGSWPPLIVAIIFEYLKRESSSWWPYFQVLPTTFNTLMFWSETELQELQASAVVNKIGKASAEKNWKETIIPVMLHRPDLFPVDGATEAEKISSLTALAHMAGSLIMAYAFDIDRDEQNANDEEEFQEDDEDEPLKGMVPFADMLNANADLNNARLFQEEDHLIMKTIKPVRAGEQLYNDYGPLPRSDLLRMYGYLTANYAQYDVVEFSHDLLVDVAGMRDSKDNAAWLEREEQLDEIGIIDDGYAVPRPAEGSTLADAVPGNIHMLLRGLTMDSSNAKMPKVKEDDSLSIKEAALLSAVATKKLAEYPTSLEQDKELVSPRSPDGIPSQRVLAAVEIRIGEKEILHRFIELCQQHISEETTEIAINDKKRKHDNNSPQSKKALKTNGKR